MVEVPQQDETLQVQSLLELEEEGFVSKLPLIRQPVVDTHDQVPFVVSVSDSYPQAFDLHQKSVERCFSLFQFSGHSADVQ